MFHFLVAIPCIVAQFFMLESARWLAQHQKFAAAEEILSRIAVINKKELPTKLCLDEVWNNQNLKLEQQRDRNYSYLDLFRYRSVMMNLAALFYSWLASSVISFGIYFNLGSLYGNVFTKYVILGLSKGTTGQPGTDIK